MSFFFFYGCGGLGCDDLDCHGLGGDLGVSYPDESVPSDTEVRKIIFLRVKLVPDIGCALQLLPAGTSTGDGSVKFIWLPVISQNEFGTQNFVSKLGRIRKFAR